MAVERSNVSSDLIWQLTRMFSFLWFFSHVARYMKPYLRQFSKFEQHEFLLDFTFANDISLYQIYRLNRQQKRIMDFG